MRITQGHTRVAIIISIHRELELKNRFSGFIIEIGIPVSRHIILQSESYTRICLTIVQEILQDRLGGGHIALLHKHLCLQSLCGPYIDTSDLFLRIRQACNCLINISEYVLVNVFIIMYHRIIIRCCLIIIRDKRTKYLYALEIKHGTQEHQFCRT